MPRRSLIPLLLVAATLAAGEDAVSPRLSANPAKVLTAGWLGSPGNEWFTAGGVLADGSILVCGVSLDAEFELMGVKATVIGEDAKALKPVTRWVKVGAADTGVVKDDPTELGTGMGGKRVDKEMEDDPFAVDTPLAKKFKEREAKRKRREAKNKPKPRGFPRRYNWKRLENEGRDQVSYRKLHWYQEECTGFAAVFDPDLKTVTTLRRLPRGAGSITAAAVAADGAVYLAGAASDRIGKFAAPLRSETVPDPQGVGHTTPGPRRTWLARMKPDLSGVEWLIDLAGWSTAPAIHLLADGDLVLQGPGLRTYTPAGELVRSVALENTRVVSGCSVSPVDGSYVRTGDWMSATGREPYRNPRCYVYDADGAVTKNLYGWRGPFIGVDSLRLVADTAVRKTAYDAAGNLFLTTWSHGGNNVAYRYPYDIERYIPNALGYVQNQTCSVIAKLDRDHNLVAATKWMAASFFRDVSVAVDGSPAWAASSSVERLPNTLSTAKGLVLAVADPDLAALRFCSSLPACGSHVVAGGCYDMADAWGFATGTSRGRPLLLVLSGAVPEVQAGEGMAKPPLQAPLQEAFAGGLTDGYLLVLDLSADKPFVPYAPPPRKKRGPPKPYDGPVAWPAEGQEFTFGAETYRNVKLTFRDATGDKWPTFYCGDAVLGGKFTYGEGQSAANFALDCKEVLQSQGDQSQRILGELVQFDLVDVEDKHGKEVKREEFRNPVMLRVTASSAWSRRPLTEVAQLGGVASPKAACTMDGTLQVGEHSVPFTGATCTAGFRIPKKADPKDALPNMAMLTIRFAITGADLGLAGELADRKVQVQACCSAFSGGGKAGGW